MRGLHPMGPQAVAAISLPASVQLRTIGSKAMAERMSQQAINAGIADTRHQLRDAVAEVESKIAEHWIWYLVLGIVLLLAGFAAIAFPLVSTIAAKLAL